MRDFDAVFYIFSEEEGVSRNGHIVSCQIDGYFTGHQLGIGAGHIYLNIVAFQKAGYSLFPPLHSLQFV